MALMAEAAAACMSDMSSGMDEELVRELLDDRGDAFFLLPQETPVSFPPETTLHMNKLISAVYSGPTIGDVEAALAVRCRGSTGEYSGTHVCPRASIALPEKGFNKMEGKFTLKVKCCSNGLADDGYKWRKYGQKLIKNSPHPRSYYRCTNPRCNAKKQVERSAEDPETLVVTYEGLHLHYAFSDLLLLPPRPRDHVSIPTTSSTTTAPPAVKKPKLGQAPSKPETPAKRRSSWQQQQQAEEVVDVVVASSAPVVQSSPELQLPEEDNAERPRGLLEDVVPRLVMKPCGSSGSSDPSSLVSVPSSPAPSSSSSSAFSWPHVCSFFDELGMVSVPSSPASSSSSEPFSWPPHGPAALFDLGMQLPGTV